MIRQEAFKRNHKFLKGNLHTHTTRSDGLGNPDEVIRLFRSKGYDFLALTDHRFYNYENFAPDTDIIIVPGMEMDNGSIPCHSGFRCYHILCLGPSREDGNGFRQDDKFDSVKANNSEEMQKYIDEWHAKNNLTVYCHPEWSSTPARYFEDQKGHFAMEIWNSGCAMENDMDGDAAYWDEILGQGKKIYGVATDDGHYMETHCNGWVMVNAERNLNSILEALNEGAFYSSCGPEIYDFYIEDNKVYIDCSEAVKIRLHCDRHPTLMRIDENGMTHAEFDLHTWVGAYDYVRISIVDKNGKKAWTNPIFLDEEMFK